MTIDVARESLLADARGRAAMLLAEADAEAAERVERARSQAEEMIAEARRQGEIEGRVAAERAAAVEQSFTRMEVLAAQREARDELCRRARSAALALREAADYPQLLDQLEVAVLRDLGEGADVERDPPGVGGVRGRAGTRGVDYTLVALAERCVASLGPRVQRLWA